MAFDSAPVLENSWEHMSSVDHIQLQTLSPDAYPIPSGSCNSHLNPINNLHVPPWTSSSSNILPL